ncbi:aspartate--tRNA ligase [bacterium]|nr:aspartate--tRNA ligase [bacterium]PIQ11552.1 MAG: aspartate--tRNA ligase [Candidatus Gracilibacteria bacterium CG18_big_fil_WC_8_21_14_2_50_38_16]PIQ42290.1 MAG: aspartate--tRNA ligase [Candidatus Gracilibacteria bacterium CG12_big_fil_rev_8_21_14_0_65_38_15]
MHRTHTCGELTAAHIGQEVTLSGWVANRRDHGGIIFIDLRDRYGITQMVFDPQDNESAWKVADTFRSEYVVKLTGKVRHRPDGQTNPALVTGEIEIITLNAEILAESKTPPFEISDHTTANEEIRFKHRYLDIRRTKVLENIKFRAIMNHFTRNWFTTQGFTEVQTPIFTVSSPEGARDFLIPSRLHNGKFYALPQAPQQYKQLLMVGGIDKYFQIAPCFRDEDPRADRHSCEFYQIDCEMSFVEQEDIFQVAESFVKDLIAGVSPEKHIRENKIYRFTHKEAKNLYGSDKPDVRFDLHFEDFTEDFRNSGFSVFQGAVATGGVVKAMKLENVAMSRSEIDAITTVAQANGAKGLAYIIYEAEGPRSPILKFFSEAEMKALEEKLQPKAGDMIFFGAGEYALVTKVLGAVRVALRDKYNLADKSELAFAWVTDFPMFERKDDGTLDFEHNPFSMPHGGATAFDNPEPTEIHGMQYDLACNGYEVLSGSIRNHDLKALVKAFEMVGKGEEEVKDKFGAMYNAFQFGVPPHGGFAFGFDRLLMILKDEDNIREVYAFPKSGKAEDVMMNAPSVIDDADLKVLGIEVRDEV